MAKIHWLKKAPKEVIRYFENHFPRKAGYSYIFYSYKTSDGRKIYGCEVIRDGQFWHNATQADLNWFKQNF